MAEFSAEYYELIGVDMISDFSYIAEFNSLKENQSFIETCEGLGVHGITRLNNMPYLIVSRNQDAVLYSEFIKEFRI